jgi:hypothetical protein
MDALVLLHLPRTDLILQIGQFLLQLVEMVLVPPIPTYLCLDGLVLEGVNTQVYLVLIRVPSAKEPYVSDSITRALTEIEEGGGVEVVGIGGGAAGTEPMDSGVIRVLHFSELGGPDVSIRSMNGHGDVVIA